MWTQVELQAVALDKAETALTALKARRKKGKTSAQATSNETSSNGAEGDAEEPVNVDDH
jgi:hypothetical protein